jgi:hypothetical protein
MKWNRRSAWIVGIRQERIAVCRQWGWAPAQ